MRTIPEDGKARDDTEWCSRGCQIFSRGWSSEQFSNHPCTVMLAIREATLGAGQVVQSYDPPRSLVGRFGGISMKHLPSTQRSHNLGRICTTGKWAIGAPGALLETWRGPASQTHTYHVRRRLQRRPHSGRCSGRVAPPFETPTDNGAHVSETCAPPQLWSFATWFAQPVPPNPRLEGHAWRGHHGAQSRPDHVLLSVSWASSPVTVAFRSSQRLRGTALAPIDLAPLRLLRCSIDFEPGPAGEAYALGQSNLSAATTDLHFAKPFV